MAKKVQAYVRLQVTTGMASPNLPVDPAPGQQGVNVMELYRAFNVKTSSIKEGLPVPIVVTVYTDCSFTFVTKTPPAAVLLERAADIKSGFGRLNKDKVGKISRVQLQRIAQTKAANMTGVDIEAITHSIEDTARSVGLIMESQEIAKLTRCMRVIREKADTTKQYDINGIIALLKEPATAKFIENVNVAVNLSIDACKSDQDVHDTTVLPHDTSRSVYVAVFTQDASAEATKATGTEPIDMGDLAGQIKKGKVSFDTVIVSPDVVHVADQLGQALGPRGLMPNPKVGTAAPNVTEAIRNTKTGQVRCCNDRNGIIRITVGKVGFNTDKLKENLGALLVALKETKPTQTGDVCIRKVSISAAIGVDVAISQTGLSASVN